MPWNLVCVVDTFEEEVGLPPYSFYQPLSILYCIWFATK